MGLSTGSSQYVLGIPAALEDNNSLTYQLDPMGTQGDANLERRLLARSDEAEPDPEVQSLPTDTVTSLLHHRQSEVLKYLQNKGMHKLAEFDTEVCAGQRKDRTLL